VQEVAHRMGASLDLINEITDQTNLLALNAAIEASRSEGGSGEGFTVVAEEVRSLAERSAGIASEIGRLVKQMKQAIEGGSASSQEAGHILERVKAQVGDLERFVQAVQRTAGEQASLEAILRDSLDGSERIVEDNSAAAEAARQLGAYLREQAARLRTPVEHPPGTPGQPPGLAVSPSPATSAGRPARGAAQPPVAGGLDKDDSAPAVPPRAAAAPGGT